MTQNVDRIASTQMQKHWLTLEVNKNGTELFWKFKADEAEKNKTHDLCMAESFAKTVTNLNANCNQPIIQWCGLTNISFP